MKKILCLLLALLLLLAALVSCRKREIGTAQLLQKLLDRAGASPGSYEVRDLASLTGSGEGKAFFSSLFFGAPLPLHLDAAKDFSAALSRKDDGFEIAVFLARRPSGKAELRELFERRLAALHDPEIRNYLGKTYEKYLFTARIFEKENYIFFLATDDNDALVSLIEKLL